MIKKKERRSSRAFKTRKKLGKRLSRLSVFRSNRHIWAQIIDDERGVTLAAGSSKVLGSNANCKIAREVGGLLAKAARKKKITRVVFDRGPYRYQGQVKALAEGAREGGLVF